MIWVSAHSDGYAPGWDGDAISMMAARSAEDRAAFVLALLSDGMHVVDVGCGPGTVSVGFAHAVAPSGSVLGVDVEPSQIVAAAALAHRAGVSTIRFEVGSAYNLPVLDKAVDVYFSHALFEHLKEPQRAFAEAHRVLAVGGVLAVVASDWSRAQLSPSTPDVALALHGHYMLRRRAGGDPFAGGRLASHVRAAGFVDIRETSHLRLDLPYRELAGYVLARLAAALAEDSADDELVGACAAAARWAATDGIAAQCWTQVTARRVA